ncbi:protein translocase subunit SecD [Pontiella agarivorans]|uniref:Multifunctional fusion protein n=1 Tax=Pontiella agarivorans TaxID=3038953 RepID=A0ABU5MSG6_9BACT|nr:protein translocase subunit SecD [Pontiella agarivorans]MDZ8117135.1 protein translocase subunit SecD [Pontiella agarivorans]
MDKNKLWKWITLFALTGMSVWMVADLGVTWGLDLQGGSSFTIQVDEADVRQKLVEGDETVSSVDALKVADVKKKVQETQQIAVEIIRNRIDGLGTAEPEIYPQGNDRIVVRLPGVDPETRADAKAQISRDAVLSFKLVHNDSAQWVAEVFGAGQMPPGFKMGGQDGAGIFLVRDREAMADEELDRAFFKRLRRFGDKPADFMLMEDRHKDNSKIYRPEFIERRRQMGGDRVQNASVMPDPMTGLPTISLEFDAEGRNEFGRVTEENVNRRLAVILDDKLYSAPNINEAIYGNASISGSFSNAEARKLANVLKAGALPGRVKIVEERTVAPTLGHDSISSGIKAIVIGGVAVLLFMGIYYLIPGMIANFSLIFVLLLLPIGMVVSSGFLGAATGSLQGGGISLPTLTLYGIAGIVLTVGMAVDANVLTFERMREEWAVGKSVSGAINAGYNKAFSTILDANITTLLTAIILFWQGSGPIRGFAVTLSAGIIVSMFIVLVITRLGFNTLADNGMLKSIKMLSIPGLKNANFNFLGSRKIAGVISLLIIIGSWGVFFKKGDANFGVDFKGGSVITFEFDQKQDIEVVRAALGEAGFPTAGIAYQSDVSGGEVLELKISDSGEDAEPALQAIKALDGGYVDVKNDSVGSQIGSELKRKGLLAIIWSLVGIIIYISIRFEFAFACGAITALAHDVLITVGIFCALGNELSMPIIAALLTIVGYSVNDTIVVFDRIREDLKLEKGKSYQEIANLSINQTLSRTLLTSVTTLLTVIMLLFFGGGAVQDFALALTIGILVGTYSSVFVATPVVLLWHKEKKVQ